MKIKLSPAKVLGGVVLVGGFVLDILNKKAADAERNTMKTELKDEIVKELMSKKD